MNANKLFIPLLLTLPLLAACEETAETDAPVPLTFSTVVEGLQTRYAADDLPGSMGVFAYHTEKSNFNASTSTPNFMYNQLMTRNGSAWSYTPMKYWPTNASDKVSFFAYAPHNARGLVTGVNTQKGYPSAAYTVAQAENDQVDLLASTPLMNQGTGEVKFNLRHALTKITIKVKSGDKLAKEITSLSINAATNGNLQFKDGGFEWKNVAGTYSYVPATTDLSFTATEQGRDIATFYLLPTATVTATYSISYKVIAPYGEALARTFTALPLSATPLWTAGGHVSYTIHLSEKTATVTAETTAWEKDEDNSAEMKIFYPDDVKPGDYFYSDGTWSDGGLRVYDVKTGATIWTDPFPAPVLTDGSGNARTCIGIVFTTRVSDSDKARGWTHGGVMALDRIDSKHWAPTSAYVDTPIPNMANLKEAYADLDGYDNTQVIVGAPDTYTAITNPAFFAADGYKATVPAPANTSSWFLPSIGQLWDIWENLGGDRSSKLLIPYRTSTAVNTARFNNEMTCIDDINRHIYKAVKRNSIVIRKGYVSSTERNSGEVYDLVFYSSAWWNIISIGKTVAEGNSQPAIIPVLVF